MDESIRCPKCGSAMVKRLAHSGPHAGRYFYGCSQYPNCSGIVNINDAGLGIARPITRVTRPKPQDNRSYTNIASLNFPIILEARPRAKGFKTIFVDSMALPAKFFTQFNNDPEFRTAIESYAKWRIDYAPSTQYALTDKQSTILSVVEKIVNRGRLTRLSGALEAKIMKDTHDDGDTSYDKDTTITTFQNYHTPNIPTEWHDGQKRYDLDDMTAEEYFYKKVFLATVGEAYAKDILPQVHFRSLVLDKEDIDSSILSQRVDFLITQGRESIAIEIDDPTHSNHVQKDEQRDKILSENGLKVYRIEADELAGGGANLDAVIQHLTAMYADLPDNDAIYESLIAIRLAHQFQLILIELMKAGKIGYGRPCKVAFDYGNLPNLDKPHQKVALKSALGDLCELCSNLTRIYKKEESIFGGIELVDRDPDILISVNDNYSYDQSKIVYIQDISYPLALQQNRNAHVCKQDVVVDQRSLKYLLNYIFRYPDFRPNQIDGIEQTLRGNDSIVLLPTGSGKSMVYQLLSYILPGMIIVIDPINSLIEDQVDNLMRSGIDRALGITRDTQNKDCLQMALEAGHYNLVFLSPERLQIDSFRTTLKKFCTWNVIPVCAIDEAHCVSEWGHDFRTSYLNLADTCRKLLRTPAGAPSILALTGTASAAVLRDMECDLGIADQYVIRPDSFDRKEIEFIVVSALSSSKSSALERIMEVDLPEKFRMDKDEFYTPNGDNTMSGIIFCPHVNGKYGVTQILNDMNSLGISTKEYSGTKPKNRPMDEDEWAKYKSTVAKQYKDNAFPLLAATKSFGMGIDKPNIRYTIHYGLPQSIESYYQEAGRAGRDRNQAYSYIIMSNDFEERNKDLLEPSSSIEDLKAGMTEHRWDGDDVDRMLFFHTGSFSGIDNELEETRKVLRKIGDLRHDRAVTIASSTNDREKIEKVIYRLSVLGIVKDYTVDYAADEFHIIINAFDKDKIIRSYGQYISRYEEGRTAAEQGKMQEIQERDPAEFVLAAMEILLREFVYNIIERSRRQAFANLLEITTTASKVADESRRSKMIRESILDFLGNTHVDVIKKITDNPDDLMCAIEIVDQTSRQEQAHLYAEINRTLEAYPQHPGLLLARARIAIQSGNFDLSNIADALAAVIGFGLNLYNVPKSEIAESVASTISQLDSDQATCAELVNALIQDKRLEPDIIDAIIDELPAEYRSILLLHKINISFAELNNIGKDNLWTAKK